MASKADVTHLGASGMKKPPQKKKFEEDEYKEVKGVKTRQAME